MMVPDEWRGPATEVPFDDYQWLKLLPGRVWCALFERVPSLSLNYMIPLDYDLYVTSFHLEPIDIKWLDQISDKIDRPIIVLADVFDTSYPVKSHVIIERFIYWHRQIEQAQEWFPTYDHRPRSITHKASAICNRITQSKLLITTALLEYMDTQAIIRLNTWLEEKNVHDRQPTGNIVLDDLAGIFWKKYFGRTIEIDSFVNEQHNHHHYTADPTAQYLQNAAIHFTNESVAYSFMYDEGRSYIYPGPFLTEKTLKCLFAGVAFVPVGQYNTYRFLETLGLKFDYPFDISWDQDPGNLSRLEGIVRLIKWLSDFSAVEIYDMVKDTESYNFDHVKSGKFSTICQASNQAVVDKLLKKFQ